jgi:hypothetical protein
MQRSQHGNGKAENGGKKTKSLVFIGVFKIYCGSEIFSWPFNNMTLISIVIILCGSITS